MQRRFRLPAEQPFSDDDGVSARINHLAVWILVIVHQLIGFGWYSIWGEKWLNLHAKTMTDIERTHDVTAYVLAIITAIIVNYTLAWLIGRLGAITAIGGLQTALLCWFSFLVVEHATVSAFSAFETNPWPLVLIDMGRPFIAFAISGLVLGAWQRRRTTGAVGATA
jgi:hypothetical protein